VQGVWLVKDTSTNGTFIDGAKVGKGNTATLQVGQRLGLSIVAPAAGPASTGFVNTVE
jgi:predicted component of type VI protein secretion system